MCLAKKLVEPNEFIVPAKEIDGPGPCGMTQPFRVTRLAGGTVALKQRMTLGCPALAEAEAWLADTIQPAANLYFGQPVAEINAGSYACRGRNNQVGAKLSEHSFGNAVDVMSFKLADGYVITVKGGWRGTEAEQRLPGYKRRLGEGFDLQEELDAKRAELKTLEEDLAANAKAKEEDDVPAMSVAE